MSNSFIGLKGYTGDRGTEFGKMRSVERVKEDLMTMKKYKQPLHKGSLPTSTLRGAVHHSRIASQVKNKSELPSIQDFAGNNESQSIIGQNLFDPSNNNSVHEGQNGAFTMNQ